MSVVMRTVFVALLAAVVVGGPVGSASAQEISEARLAAAQAAISSRAAARDKD